MIRLTKEEYYNFIKILKKFKLDISHGGGTIGGRHVVYLNNIVVGKHQFEYEEYCEFDKSIYERYMKLYKVLTENQ